MSNYAWILEIKRVLVGMSVMAEIIAKDKWHSGCLIRELGAMKCRNGCLICELDVKMKHLEKAIPNLQEHGGNDKTLLI